MSKQLIFYGAGRYAQGKLVRWLAMNIMPVCFSDADECKHYKFITALGGKSFEILPLDEVFKRYPEYELCITVMPDSVEEVYNALTKLDIPPERIRLHPEHKQTPQHCQLIGRYLVIDGVGIRTCCAENSVCLLSNGDFRDDLAYYSSYCEQLRNDLNDCKLTSCLGCHMLVDGRSDEELQIEKVNLSTGLPGGDCCNFKCCYCTYGETLGACERKDNILEILHIIGEVSSVKYIQYACGEISISPYREEILQIWIKNRWHGHISSNAAIYFESVANLLRQGNVILQTSLDAGTWRTFKRIKGFDCFDKVVENLYNYASTGGGIALKYILLKEYNLNALDIDNFVEIARDIKAHVVISRDNRIINTQMSEEEYSALSYLVQQCKKQTISYRFVEMFVARDLNRLKSDGFI